MGWNIDIQNNQEIAIENKLSEIYNFLNSVIEDDFIVEVWTSKKEILEKWLWKNKTELWDEWIIDKQVKELIETLKLYKTPKKIINQNVINFLNEFKNTLKISLSPKYNQEKIRKIDEKLATLMNIDLSKYDDDKADEILNRLKSTFNEYKDNIILQNSLKYNKKKIIEKQKEEKLNRNFYKKLKKIDEENKNNKNHKKNELPNKIYKLEQEIKEFWKKIEANKKYEEAVKAVSWDEEITNYNEELEIKKYIKKEIKKYSWVVDYLKKNNKGFSYKERKNQAIDLWIENYRWTKKQNIQFLKKLLKNEYLNQ